MSSHLVFSGIDDAVKARLKKYWEEKLRRLQKLLVPYPTDLREIRLTVSHHQDTHRSWYEGRAVIHLSTGTLAAEANGKDPQVVLDRITDALVREVKRHKERVRRDSIFKRKARSRADLSAAGPLLQEKVEAGRPEDFFRLLRPHLGVLRHHARRELSMLEMEGVLHRGEVTVDDLLDEVLSRAWQQFSNRPRHLRLDLWLTDLLHDALEQWVKQEPRKHASLEERAGESMPREAPQVDDQEWWASLLGDEETFTVGDLIPDVVGAEAWEQLEVEEQMDRLLSLMGKLPPALRRTFLLHALENDDPAEIAMLQDRPESQLKADIEAARQWLKERLLAGGDVKETGEPAKAPGAATETRGDLALGSHKA